MAQEVERRLGKAEVTGSNPVSSSNNKKGCYRMNFSLCNSPLSMFFTVLQYFSFYPDLFFSLSLSNFFLFIAFYAFYSISSPGSQSIGHIPPACSA